MITLHKKKNHQESAELEEKLKDLIISFETETHDEGEGGDLPYIVEDGKTYRTEEEINGWYKELRSELNVQRSITGDGCYIDPKSGTIG